MKKHYEVVVGNVGTMPYTSKKLAEGCYTTYVTLSKKGEGRAGNEAVTLLLNGEIVKEHIPVETSTYRIPAHYAVALINDDLTGLEDEEVKILWDWLDVHKPGRATPPEGKPFFAHGHDINRNQGADCLDVVFIKQ